METARVTPSLRVACYARVNTHRVDQLGSTTNEGRYATAPQPRDIFRSTMAQPMDQSP